MSWSSCTLNLHKKGRESEPSFLAMVSLTFINTLQASSWLSYFKVSYTGYLLTWFCPKKYSGEGVEKRQKYSKISQGSNTPWEWLWFRRLSSQHTQLIQTLAQLKFMLRPSLSMYLKFIVTLQIGHLNASVNFFPQGLMQLFFCFSLIFTIPNFITRWSVGSIWALDIVSIKKS